MDAPLLIAAAALSVAYGANSGGAIVATGLGMRVMRPIVAVAVLGVAVALAPVAFGTAVATTFASELVVLEGPSGRLALLAAVVTSLLVTTALSAIGIATSLTLALVGAIAGAGFGAGLDVAWGRLAIVLGGIAIAPVLGAIAAAALRAALPRLWRRGGSAAGRIAALHAVAFPALALAFGANDAQKLLAVVSVGAATVAEPVPAVWWQVLAIGALFGLGAALGTGRMARPTTAGLLPLRPLDAATSELATAAVMFAGSVFGNPAGMAQTLSGSFIGIGLVSGRWRVRWEFAGKIVNAWAATMPAAFGIAGLLGLAIAVLT